MLFNYVVVWVVYVLGVFCGWLLAVATLFCSGDGFLWSGFVVLCAFDRFRFYSRYVGVLCCE